MTIDEIRKLSLEYAKGHVKTGPAWRSEKKKHLKKKNRKPETYAQWFARSLVQGKRAGPPPNPPRPSGQTDAYKHQPPGDDGVAPWDKNSG
jgi:hypothetical protein